MTTLKAENLHKSFGRRPVVKGVDIHCSSGEIIGLLGRNGAGKTTCFQMIVGLLKPDLGRILLDDRDITATSTHIKARLGITYLPQENSVFLKASVKNNLDLILELQPGSRRERDEKIASLLNELGMTEHADQSAHSLSGGERRRLEISRSLALNPSFLLLDEPFTGIDPLTIRELQKILLSLKEKGIGIILSDHNVRDTFRITDRAYIIDDGEILIEGKPRHIIADIRARERFLGKNFKQGKAVQLSLFGETTDPPELIPERSKTEKNTQ